MKLLSEFVVTPTAAPVPKIESDAEVIAKKEQFAQLSLREQDAFKIALVIYPDDTSRALRVANEWPNDEQVKTFRQSYIDAEEDGETAFLPTKAEAARLAWNIARDSGVTEDRLKALKLYADIRGFIERPSVAIQNNTLVQNKVLVVKNFGSDEQWEQQVRKQQTKLINGDYSAIANQ